MFQQQVKGLFIRSSTLTPPLLLKPTVNLWAVADFHLHSFPPPREAAGETEAHSCCGYERGTELWVTKAGGSHAGHLVGSLCFIKGGGEGSHCGP